MKLGNSILGAVFTFSMVAGGPAMAAQNNCVEAFKNAKENFELRMKELSSEQSRSNSVVVLSGVAGLICLKFMKGGWLRKTACGSFFGVAGTAAGVVSVTTSSKMSRLHDSYRLYQIYQATYMNPQDPNVAKSPEMMEARTMIKDLEKDLKSEDSQAVEIFRAKLQKAPEQFATLMEFGKFCEGGMQSYPDAMRVMKEWLHAPAQ